MPYQPSSVTVKLSNPGPLVEASYFDVAVVGSSLPSQFPAVGSVYDGWCLDTTVGTRFGTDLKAYMYSSGELNILEEALPNLGTPDGSNLDRLDSMNWLLGAYNGIGVVANGVTYPATYGDVQSAIWKMLGEVNYLTQPGMGPVNAPNVDLLASLALTLGDQYLPDAGQPLGVVLKPVHLVNGVETALQPILIETVAARLGDFVWYDRDADGVQDAGEAGIAGATVELVRDLNKDGDFGDPNEVLASTQTDAAGAYAFKGLTPGLDYQVRFVQPAGFDAASPRQADGSATSGTNSDGLVSNLVVLAPGENNPTLDAGFYKLASLGDRAWVDSNANGQQDTGEAGLAGVKVELYACVANKPSGLVLATTTTDVSGNYLFTGLKSGDYIVKFITPAGYKQTTANVGADATDSDAGTGGLTGCYNLESGETEITVDAGYWKAAKLGDRVWLDANANGRQDSGETGVANVKVELYACVGNAPSGAMLATQSTDANGLYLFSNLKPGDYIVKFITPSGYTLTTANVGSDGADSDAATGGLTGCYTLASGQTNKTVDAGLVLQVQPASLGDRIWEDRDADGQQDAGENGIAGLNVTLIGGGADGLINGVGDTLGSTITGTDGFYQFTGLTPGVQYQVQFSKPAGSVYTSTDIGNDASDSDANPATGRSQIVTLASGENNPTIDAGVYAPAGLGDRVWEDKNADGRQDPGEDGISGAIVKLYTCVNDAPGVFVAQTSTDAAGNYSFTNLPPGEYIVEFVTPGGFTRTAANVGADGTDSDVGTGGLTGCYDLTPGEVDNTVDGGFYRPAAIGDRVWIDSDGDGQQDSGETGVGDVTVELYACVGGAPSGAALAVTTTDGGGNYAFIGLMPGDYIVKFVTPSGYALTSANVGADGTDSDAGAGGLTGCYNLESGETDNTVDAGLVPVAPGIEIIKDAGQSIVGPNVPVTFTYSVKNTGGVALSNIAVVDDNATPELAADDFNPTPVLGANGNNVGDVDGDNQLDLSEVWKFSATAIPPVVMTVTPAVGGPTYDSGVLSYQTLPNGDVRVFYRQDKNFNDNTYGTGSEGWVSRTHTFGDLTGSDKAGFLVKYSDGSTLAQFYQDYISSTTTQDPLDSYPAYSNYRSLGISGGDGSFVAGNSAVLKDFDSTLELNLNRPGTWNGVQYTAMIVNSPTGANQPNDPSWDKTDGYYFTIDKSAFAGGKTFGGVTIFDQHNSPAKTGGSNSYIPNIVGGASINTATVTGIGNGTTVTDDDDATVVVNPGALGSLGDRVWLDIDADGVQDAGESGISGVKVNLAADFDQNGTIDYTATTTTGANGIYLFAGLPAGEYQVTVDGATLPAHVVQTYDLDGLATPNVARGELASAQNRVDFDFGYVPSAPGFSLVKTADKATAGFGEKVTYTYSVHNTGAQPLTNVVVKDDNATPNDASDDFSPVYVGGDVGNLGTLDPGETWTYAATVTPPIKLTATNVNGYSGDAGTLTNQVLANGDVRVTYRQSTNVNDNTYGTGSSAGWAAIGKTHTFGDLTGSDKAGFELKDAGGQVVMKFYMDYVSATSTQETAGEYANYSGYRSMGVTGGDGSILLGSAANLYDFDSTIELNLNRAGYTTTTVNSPVGDPNWDVVDGFSFTVKAAAFGAAGFGSAAVFDQHNSPSKLGVNSFDPAETGGEATNTAIVTAKLDGNTVVAVDDATVVVGNGGGTGGITPKFFVVDIGADDAFKYSSAGAKVGSFALLGGNSDPRDVAASADGSKLWVIDKDKSVNVYEGDGTTLGVWKVDGLGNEAEGLTLDGNDLWMADRSRKIYWYEDAAARTAGTDSADKSFAPAMNGNLKGIVTDGNSLWAVTEGGTDYVYRFAIARDGAGNPTGLTQDGLWKLATANAKPTGITLDPTGASQSLWVVDESTDTVYEYGNARSLTSGTGTVSASYKLAAGNTSPQGIADPLDDGSSALDSIAADLQAFVGPALLDGHALQAVGSGGLLQLPSSASVLPSVADLLGDGLGSLDVLLGGLSGQTRIVDLGGSGVGFADGFESWRRMTELTRHEPQTVPT